jgi:hypothetical protein
VALAATLIRRARRSPPSGRAPSRG